VGDHIHGFDVGRLSEQLLCPGHQSSSEASTKVGLPRRVIRKRVKDPDFSPA